MCSIKYALSVTMSGVNWHIPLPDFTFSVAETLIGMLRAHGGWWLVSRGSRPVPRKSQDFDERLRLVLTILWLFIVKPVLHSLNLKAREFLSESLEVHPSYSQFHPQKPDWAPPRLWWCPTGLFTHLPIHAAGIYYSADFSESIFDYVVSSYTPTLKALLAPLPPAINNFDVMVVIGPNIPGHSDLPGTVEELRRIEEHVPSEHLHKFGIPGSWICEKCSLPASSRGHISFFRH